jgi:hypothetical protein
VSQVGLFKRGPHQTRTAPRSPKKLTLSTAAMHSSLPKRVHSQQMQSAPKSIDVRFAPKATVSHRTAMRRNGPKADILRCSENAPYSITSSAAAMRPGGIVRPIVLAAFRLIVVSYFVGA